MDPKKNSVAIFGKSMQSITDQTARDTSTPAFTPSVRIPSHTTAYKGYTKTAKAQWTRQKKPSKKIPRSLFEK